jgi:hypothetical protein
MKTKLSHYHKAANGKLVECWHTSKSVLTSAGFYWGITLTFPLEHILWEKVWPFNLLTQWFGL